MSLTIIILLILIFLSAVLLIKLLSCKNQLKKLESQAEKNKKKLLDKEKKIQKLDANIKNRLKKARNIHQRMLPDKLIEPEGYFISDYYQPAEYIGGDYYNFFKIDHESLNPFFDQYLLYFFDVSGHGIDSTLLSIFVNESIENYFKLRHSPGEKISPQKLMNYIDQQYQKEDFPDDYLVCLFIAVLDKNKNTLTYSSGGFQFPIYLLNQKEEIEEINIGGLPISTALGSMADQRLEQTIDFEKNSTLLLSTDGLLEQQRGSKSYEQQLKKLLAEYKFLPAAFLKDLIRSDFYNFTNDRQAEDDITYLLLERPAGEIIELELDTNNFEQMRSELEEFLNQNLWSQHGHLDTLTEIIKSLLDLAAAENFELKIKGVNNQKLLFFSLEKMKNTFGWDQIINDYPDLISIAEKRINNQQDPSQKIFFEKEEIYYSHSNLNNKLNLMLIKK